MPIEWYLMDRPLFNNGFENEEFCAYSRDGFEEVLSSVLADNIKIYDKRLDAEPVLTRAIIQGTTSDTYNNSVLRQFLCRIGTLRSGQYIKARNQMWMVYSMPDNNKMYEKAVAWQCKYSIRFISPITGKIVEYPVHDINSTQYGSGETPKERLTIGTAQHLIYIPYNEETIKIDSGFRFLIDKNKENPTAYRLAQVDPAAYSCGERDGVIQWTVVESQFDKDTDNRELMIADYYGRSDLSYAEEIKGYDINFSSDVLDNTVVFGEEARIDVSFKNDGVDIEPLAFTATVIDGNEYGSITEVGSDYIVVRMLDNRDYIGQEVTILVENSECDISKQLTLKIGGWY